MSSRLQDALALGLYGGSERRRCASLSRCSAARKIEEVGGHPPQPPAHGLRPRDPCLRNRTELLTALRSTKRADIKFPAGRKTARHQGKDRVFCPRLIRRVVGLAGYAAQER
jgi:hypothetical protein